MLESILSAQGGMTVGGVLLCTGVSLALGVAIALVYMYRNSYSRNFVVAIALLPAIVQSVIMLVNGNLGVGVAVMGAFSLVRFRSAPGSAKEIASIFFAMAVGLATGMGYVGYAAGFCVVISAVMLLFARFKFGERGGGAKTLRVTIPEDLDYTGLFDDLFGEYASRAELEKVRTTNLGSLFELQYAVHLKPAAPEKEFIDKLRARNGNLNITLANAQAPGEGL